MIQNKELGGSFIIERKHMFRWEYRHSQHEYTCYDLVYIQWRGKMIHEFRQGKSGELL
jgi:hypothetical protein